MPEISVDALGAIACGKLAGKLSRLAGRGGTALPGLLALALQPKVVRRLASQLPRGSILVAGTNGKTTTTRMVASILRQAGQRPLYNNSGSNLMRGLATSLLQGASLLGAIPREITTGLFEIDEATLPHAIRETKPKLIIVTNLFRDQLDRYGEVDSVASLWRQAISQLPQDTCLVLNSDDPVVAGLGRDVPNRVVYYGIDDLSIGRQETEHAADATWCPACGVDYHYATCFYGHIGHFSCPSCGRARPQPHVRALRVERLGFSGTSLDLALPTERLSIRLGLPGTYNVYNGLAATAAAVALGLEPGLIKDALEGTTAAFGRVEKAGYQGRTICLVLAKNPIGLNEAVRTILAGEGQRNLLFVLNDNIADGQDISWIWDADFELLRGRVGFVTAGGCRAEDMALRLKYAGIEGVAPEKDLREALLRSVERTPEGDTLYIVPTYTAMLEVRRELSRLVPLEDFWVSHER